LRGRIKVGGDGSGLSCAWLMGHNLRCYAYIIEHFLYL
jgi:hypothetical protein